MGFHMLDFIVVAVIGLALFGPKAFQSFARSAGKGVAQAKSTKEKILAELPMEEIASVTDSISQIPLSPQQAVRMLILPEPQTPAKKDQAPKIVEPSAEKKVDA